MSSDRLQRIGIPYVGQQVIIDEAMAMDFLVIVAIWCAFAASGAWIATQKSRDALEGFLLGLLFGPVGVLIELFLPMNARLPGSTAGSLMRGSIDEMGIVTMIANRFRNALEEADPNWKRLPSGQIRALLKPVEETITDELEISHSRFADYAAEARRMLFMEGT
jgi:hypothetical protein